MNKFFYTIFFSIIIFSVSYLYGRDFRVSQVPNGNKFSCNTCHTNGGGTPLNDFGQLVSSQFLDQSGNVTWNASLAMADPDGDGFSNGEELQDPNGEWVAGTDNPGDADLVTHPGDGSDFPPVTSVEDQEVISNIFALNQNYPNPFNPTTTISFNLSEASEVNLKVYNILGEEVALIIQQNLSAGSHQVEFNATNLLSGTYFYRIEAGNNSEIRKMVLLK